MTNHLRTLLVLGLYDSWLAYGAHGTVFQVVFAINQVARYTTAIAVSRSLDGGETWSDPVSLIADTDPEFFDDRPTITVDPKHPDRVYVVWDRIDDTSTPTEEHWVQPFYLARSFDNGATWESPRNVLDTPVNSGTVGHDLVVLADGTLVDAYDLATDTTNAAQVVRSSDGGATWGPPIHGRAAAGDLDDPQPRRRGRGDPQPGAAAARGRARWHDDPRGDRVGGARRHASRLVHPVRRRGPDMVPPRSSSITPRRARARSSR